MKPRAQDSIEQVGIADRVRSLARGAISIVWLDFLAYLGQAGAISGFERGRRDLMIGLALAALIGTLFSRRNLGSTRLGRARDTRTLAQTVHGANDAAPPSGAGLLARSATALACFLSPALLVRIPGTFALRPTGIGALDAFLIALLPTSVLLWFFSRGRTHPSSFSFGMLVGYATTELVLLPSFGWSAALGAWALAWIACEARTELQVEPSNQKRPANGAALLAASWGIVAGAAATCARPLLFQHVSATRAGSSALVLVTLIGLCAGAWLVAALRQTWNTRWWMLLAGCLSAVSLWICFQNLTRPNELSPVPFLAGSSEWPAITWTASKQGWLYLGFPAVALGALLGSCHPRGRWIAAAVVCGTCAGVWLGESLILPRWFDPRDGAPSRLISLAQHPVQASIDEAAWNPDGIAVRYDTVAALQPAHLVHWQAQRWERDPSWRKLEESELLLPRRAAPDAPELWIVGHLGPASRQALLTLDPAHVHVLDPLPGTDEGHATKGVNPDSILWAKTGRDASVVMLAHAQQPSCFSLRETSTCLQVLRSELAPAAGSLWLWCDPRALTPSGVMSELAGWAAEFPDARLYVLQDGYAGPLFGLQLCGSAEFQMGEEIAPLIVLAARMSDCIPTRTGSGSSSAADSRAPSLDWPALEWRAAAQVSPFTLPDEAVLEAIANALSTPVSRPAGRLFEVLAVHSRAQVDRPSFHTKWDRIKIEAPEIEAALALLRERPDFDPTARAIGNIAQVLYEKHDYDILFDVLKEALELRPDVALYHHLLGRVRHELLDPEGAVAEYELALALDPGSNVIKSELAFIHSERGRWPIAVRLLEEVWTATTPPDPVIAKALGLGYLEIGKLAQAKTMLEFAWHEAPGDIEIRRAFDRLDAMKH